MRQAAGGGGKVGWKGLGTMLMNATERSRALEGLLSRLRAHHGAGLGASAPARSAPGEIDHGAAPDPQTASDAPECPIERCFHGDGVLREFVRAFLAWESTLARADEALARIAGAVVDVNELRVCLPDELAGLLGGDGPVSRGGSLGERVVRLRAALGDVYKREHQVRLGHLAGKSKRDARAYLESLKGVPPYVSARTALLALEAHAVPLDEHLRQRLVACGVLDAETDVVAGAAQLERMVKAEDALEVHHLLQAWCDTGKPAAPARAAKAPARRATASPAKNGTPSKSAAHAHGPPKAAKRAPAKKGSRA